MRLPLALLQNEYLEITGTTRNRDIVVADKGRDLLKPKGGGAPVDLAA
jgi:hypothetical protein